MDKKFKTNFRRRLGKVLFMFKKESSQGSAFKLSGFLFVACLIISFFVYLQGIFVKQGFPIGDVGGNLYAMEAVTRGEIPYKNFIWIYGPLMLYYHALFFKWFGSNIQSALWAKLFLEVAFTGVFFLAARRIMPLWGAFFAALAYCVFKPEFLHSFVHYGGVCMEIGILWAVLSYCQKAQEKYVLSALGIVFILGIIKLNFGIVFLGGVFICIVLCDLFEHRNFSFGRIRRYGFYFFVVVFSWFLSHYFFVRTLSWHQINQCFPILKDYCFFTGTPHQGIVQSVKVCLADAMNNKSFSVPIAVVAFPSCLWCLGVMFQRRSAELVKGRNFFLICILLAILTVCAYHEFYIGRIDYQAYWAKPFTVLLIAYLICEACLMTPARVQGGILIFFFVIIGIQGYKNFRYLESFKDQEHFFEFDHMNIYVTEIPKDIRSMLYTVRYIKKHIPQDQLFFTFPINAGYYYLTDRPSPVWFLYALRANKLTIEQEREIIQDLERKGVNYIVLPSISYATFGQFGKFGRDYLLALAPYVEEHYKEIARFGEWSPVSDEKYIGGMGTKILKRKGSF